MNPDVKQQKLIEMMTLLNDGLTKADFEKAFEDILKVVKTIKELNSVEIDQMKGTIGELSQSLKDDTSTDLADIRSQVQLVLGGQIEAIQAKIQAVDKAMKDKKDGKDGIDGIDGQDADEEKIVAEVLSKIPKPLKAEEVRDKLETLKGEERLDAKFIKNLPERAKQLGMGNAHNALWTLMDVDVADVAIGQSIKWDGIRWIPFTPAGGGNTAVYNEEVAGDTNTFTLAHTPASGTLRVYANGQRLVPTTDYSLSTATITTVSPWSATNITADYEY